MTNQKARENYYKELAQTKTIEINYKERNNPVIKFD